jgi:2-polyprenyl-3-methyl-5-hydroxy-6-metoxy-1,4-benzoquinol methylase
MYDLTKFWKTVPEGWRHFTVGDVSLTKDKRNRIINRVNKNLISKLDFSEINTTLDWGCGGGLLSKELSKNTDIGLIDISEGSIKNAKEYLGDIKTFYDKVIPNDLTNFKYDGDKVDLIFSNEVIQHFPSIRYFKSVINCWKSISPKYIAIQIKLNKETKECKNYEKDYLNGLMFKESDFIEYFNKIGYSNINKGYDITQGGIRLGYYIFEKN